MSVDRYLDRSFHPILYNCWHFARDVWRDLTGQDIGPRPAPPASYERQAGASDPCLALLLPRRGRPHVGVLTGGRLLHLSESGAVHVPLEVAMVGFEEVRFYKCRL